MGKINHEELEKAKKELEEFLETHPNMREYQKEIDRVLDSSSDRLEVIGIMLSCRLSDLNCLMQELRYSLEEFSHDIALNKAA